MSIELMTIAWKTKLATTPKMVMLVMCDRASEDGGQLWPSVDYIAARSSVSVRQVQRTLRELEDAGLLSIVGNVAGGKAGMTRHYRINVPELQALADAAKTGDAMSPVRVTPCHPTGDTCVTPRVTFATETGDTHVTQSINDPPNKHSPKSRTAVAVVSLNAADLVADGLTETTAAEWIEVRRKRRSPLTPLAWCGMKEEAAIAGWAIEAAIRKSITRGWQSFDAAWLMRDQAQRSGFARRSTHDLSGKDYSAGIGENGRIL